MIDGIKWLFQNWWGPYKDPSAILIHNSWMFFVVYGGFLLCTLTHLAWKSHNIDWNSDNDTAEFWGNIMATIFGGLVGSLLFLFAFPLLVVLAPIGLFVWLYMKFVLKVSKNYHKIKASQESQRLSALAQLIKDDPKVKAAYESIMANSMTID